MDLADYVRLLRRGAPTIIALLVLAALASVAYLGATAKVYQATAVILVSPHNPKSIGDLQVGAQYAQSSAADIATLIGTSAVLTPAAKDLRSDQAGSSQPATELDSAVGTVTAAASPSSAVITVSSSASNATVAAAAANAVASRATVEVPKLISTVPNARSPLLDLEVIQSASPPGSPVSPRAKRVVVLFMAVGLALGLALTLVRQSLDSRLRRSEDIAEMTSVPLLGTLARDRGRGPSPVVVRDAPASPSVEGYRVLRTNLSGAVGSDQRRSVLLAAARADTLAVRVPVNLAWSLAQAGRRVLLIDLDLRQSAIAPLLDLTARVGAADVLKGDAELRDVTLKTSLEGLNVVPGGRVVAAPSDLLSGPVLSTLVEQAEAHYDEVVVHAPALLSYTDAAVVARAVSRTVVVVRAGHTHAPDLTRAMGVLANVGVTPTGLVLTHASISVADNLRNREARTTVKVIPGGGVRREAGKTR